MRKKLLQSLGFASLFLLVNYADLLGGGQNVRLHTPFSLATLCLAQVTDILLVAFVVFLALAPLSLTGYYPSVQFLLAAAVPPFILFHEQPLYPVALPPHLLQLITILWILLLIHLRLRAGNLYRTVIHFGSALAAGFALFALLSIAQLLWLVCWHPPQQQIVAAWQTTPQPPRDHPLIVWIVFDELAYDQTFGHRDPSLAMPNFDRLRNLSTLYTNVQPDGSRTVRVLPSLLSGLTVDDWSLDLHNRFQVHFTGVDGWHQLPGSATLFGDAHRLGWRTAVVGWYNPYCSLYADALDSCYWTFTDQLSGPMAAQNSLSHNIFFPLHHILFRRISIPRANRIFNSEEAKLHLQGYLDLEAHRLQLLRTDQADFLFFHVGVPHAPNIWNRRVNTYVHSCDASYLDSLALADRLLGEYLDILQASPRWPRTTVIVQGDHSWRTNLWRYSATWTAEDTAASHNRFDSRPALLIHAAGQSQPASVDAPVPLLGVHAAIQRALANQPPEL